MNPALIKKYLNSDLAQALDLHVTEQADLVKALVTALDNKVVATDAVVDSTLALLGAANPASGDTTTAMNFLKLIYNQLGQDDPVSADRTTIMNYLKLLESNAPKDSSAFTPGGRPVGLDAGATKQCHTDGSQVNVAIVPVYSYGTEHAALEAQASPYGTGTQTKDTNALSFTVSPASGDVAARAYVSTSPIDVTNLKKLTFDTEITAGASASFMIGLTPAKTGYPWSNFTVSSTVTGLGRKQTSLDVSAYSGSYYVQITFTSSNAVNGAGKLYGIGFGNWAYAYGFLLKSMPRFGLDRILFPKIYKPANTKCQVDICGADHFPEYASTTVHRTGTPISGGDFGANVKANAFDDTYGTYWNAAQQNSQSGVAYIGMSFATDVKITGFTVRQFAAQGVASVKSQISADGTTWTDVATHTLQTGGGLDTISFSSAVTAKHFRLLANANVGGFWTIHDITIQGMLAQYPQAAASGTITLPSTASATNDYYKDDLVLVCGGVGAGQVRKITAYNGTTKVATLDQAWTTVPTTMSAISVLDCIQSNVSPGFDIQTIDYTVYPTINILCSLEKQTGATASPSMGVPVVTSVEKDWVSQPPTQIYPVQTTTFMTLLSVTGRARLDAVCGYSASPNPIIRITLDGAVLPEMTLNIYEFLFSFRGMEAQSSLLVEVKGSSASSFAIGAQWSR